MRRILSIILVFILVMPTSLWAKEMDKDLERLILSTKQKIEVPTDLTEFNYSLVNDEKGGKFYFSWQDKKREKGELSVVVDKQTEALLSYSYYAFKKENDQLLAKLSYESALEKAKTFLKQVAPEYADQLKLDTEETYLDRDKYEFNFFYCPNGIKVRGSRVFIAVDKQDGTIFQFYGINKDTNSYGPNSPKLSLKQAEAIYKDKLAGKLSYKIFRDYKTKTSKSFLAYIVNNSGNKVIDAATGKVFVPYEEEGNIWGRNYTAKETAVGYDGKTEGLGGLTPEELKVVEVTKGLLTKEEAVKRAATYFPRLKDIKITSGNLYKDDWAGRYIWNIGGEVDIKTKGNLGKENLSKEKEMLLVAAGIEGENSSQKHISFSINAETGEIIEYHLYLPYEEEVPQMDEQSMRSKVEDLAKTLAKDKFEKTYYVEKEKTTSQPNEEQEETFYFQRLENNLPVDENGLYFTYNKVYDEITHYTNRWDEVTFEPMKGKVQEEEIIKKLGLELLYVNTSTSSRELVYGHKDTYSLFNPYTAERIDDEGKPIIEEKAQNFYTDLEGHPSKSIIKKLYESGYYLGGKQFRPDQGITQVDFLRYIQQMSNPNIQEEEVYERAIREGILEETEKDPSQIVTHELMVKYLVNKAGYKKVAMLKGIYNYPFNMEEVEEDLKGYITLASGLGLLTDATSFKPKAEVTRAQAASYIYKSIQQ